MKILLLNAPCVGAPEQLKYEQSPLLFMSTTEVLGGLEHHGHDVDCIDLNGKNYKMGNMYDNILSKSSIDILTDYNKLLNFIINIDHTHQLSIMAKNLIDDIMLDDYDEYIFSISRWFRSKTENISTLHFAVILSALFPKKVYVGGDLFYIIVDEKYLKKIISIANIKTYFTGDGREHLSKFLNDYNGDVELNLITKLPKSINLDISPSINIKNIDQLKVDYDKCFSQHIQQKHQIQKIDTLTIPYRFSTGCPFNCSFCSTRKSLIYKNVFDVVDDLERWHDLGYTDFMFLNDNINFKKAYIFDFCNEILKRNMKIQFSDSANLIVCSEEMFSALADAGCVMLAFGTESFSPEILKSIGKRHKRDLACTYLEMAHKNDIFVCANIICNFPYESVDDFNHTLKFLDESRHIIDLISANTLDIYRGSDHYLMPEKFNITLTKQEGDLNILWHETNGLQSVEKIKRRGYLRLEQLYERYSFYNNIIMQNHDILYTLRKQFNKKKSKQIMLDIIKEKEHH